MPDNPNPLVIKVTDNEQRCYYVHFHRDDHALIDVREYKTIYVPGMGSMSSRTKAVVDAARSRIGQPIEGVKQ